MFIRLIGSRFKSDEVLQPFGLQDEPSGEMRKNSPTAQLIKYYRNFLFPLFLILSPKGRGKGKGVSSKRGLTFIEIIVGTLLLAIVAAGTLGCFVGAERFVILTKHKMEALNFARKATEILKGKYTYTDLGPPEPDIGQILQDELSNIGNLTYIVEETQPEGYKKIKVTVNWDEPEL